MSELPKSDLPILLLGSLGAIHSLSRLQKMAFLSDMELFKGAEYSDWKPHYYGPFSDDLEKDIEHYALAGLIGIEDALHPPSCEPVSLHYLTLAGRSKFDSICEDNMWEIAEIQKRLARYQFHNSNARLMAYVYRNYEDYTTGGAIKGSVAS